MGNSNRKLRKRALCTALGTCLAFAAAPAVMAQSNVDGSVAGHTTAGAAVTVVNPATGYTRTVHANANGDYRITHLPVGTYTLSVKQDGSQVGENVGVSIDIGRTTRVNVGPTGTGGGEENATSLGGVEVAANAIAPIVDVSSTEASAMNVSREQLQRVPVERNVASVTLMAPGVQSGKTSFGGISFGGSSIAENAFYVNGLNVTDFYNRNGFSEAPYAFYEQFQVKTGGYSVKYGRTTGGVVNTVVRSGTNDFHFGTDFNLEPSSWQSVQRDHYDENGRRYYTASRDQHSLVQTDVWASGPIVKDKLFFFALYQARGNDPRNTNDAGNSMTINGSDTGFWGVNVDWNITDRNTLSVMAFSDKNKNVGDDYEYNYATDTLGDKINSINSYSGGRDWAVTWSSYFTDNLSMRLMYGRNERQSYSYSDRDLECNYVAVDDSVLSENDPGVQTGCTSSSTVYKRNDTRKQWRADFEWDLGNHLLSFGYDHENDTSVSDQHYTGPGEYYYNVWYGKPGDSIENGATIPAGLNAYVRQREYSVGGTFPTINSAFYIQDDWQVSPNLLLSFGLRNDSFDNQDAEGRSYMKIDRQLAPRLGFSWDVKGDGTTKLFGNLGRYYLPVANVINIKQAGGLLDRRTYYAFKGWEIKDIEGTQYAVPKLGPQLGAVDDSQGDGTVGDLRSEVDKNIDPVYQDELILGFQQMLTDKWSWGVSGTYRRLHRAIDDMNITATGQCGPDGAIGWVMANPGDKVTVWGDTDCDGEADGYVTVDTSKEGWAKYDSEGNYLGQTGWKKPKRTYAALELQVDRAWDDKWSLNASYILSWSRGNAEGPINSDTNFNDTGRTENFDDPWVNSSSGYLPNDMRHQFKFRGTYALSPHWQIGGSLDVHSGTPVTAYGVGNPYDGRNYHSYFICVDNCSAANSQDRVYEPSPGGRGGYDRLHWIYDLNASITYLREWDNGGQLKAKLAFYNLLNQQRTVWVNQDMQTTISSSINPDFERARGFQSARYAALTVSLSF